MVIKAKPYDNTLLIPNLIYQFDQEHGRNPNILEIFDLYPVATEEPFSDVLNRLERDLWIGSAPGSAGDQMGVVKGLTNKSLDHARSVYLRFGFIRDHAKRDLLKVVRGKSFIYGLCPETVLQNHFKYGECENLRELGYLEAAYDTDRPEDDGQRDGYRMTHRGVDLLKSLESKM